MTTAKTTVNQALASCRSCHLLFRKRKHAEAMKCPRCGSRVHQRKPASLQRTWALVLAALVFYIPANVLPITTVVSLGSVQSDTIMSGVIYFIVTGMWPIALVIFVASVFGPLAKLMILVFLLLTIQFRSQGRPRDRTRLYRLTEVIGRWSMVDIFVVTMLVALVNLGSLATVHAGPAAVYFSAVVVITMLAAMSFDPRLIWDAKENAHE